ncbi:MAG: cytochrome c biogenesis protein CcdA [Arachnia sp.]
MSAAITDASSTTRRGHRLLPVVVGVLATVALTAGALTRPDLAPVLAGCVLLVVGFAVMAPCSIQMALTMSRVVTRTQTTRRHGIRSSAGLFALGYVGFYIPFALVLGGVARVLGDWSWVAVALGAVASLLLGLSALGAVNLGALSRCRGPLWLLRSGRASFQRPFKAGVAFGQYCATCCGPYVLAIAVLAGGSRNFTLGAGIVAGYAVVMAIPFLAPAVLAPDTYAQLGAKASRIAPLVERTTGFMLVGLSLALVPVVAAAVVG